MSPTKLCLILLIIHSGVALECYTCSSHAEGPLNDCHIFNYYDNHKKSVCMPDQPVCAKFAVLHDGITWVHRSCRPYDICGYLNTVYRTGRDQLLECTTCSDENLCNSTSQLYDPAVISVLGIFVMSLLI